MVIKYRFRLYLFTLVLLLGFGALAQRLWNLTIERHDEFVNRIPGTKELKARIPGTRGEIRDRNGILLVSNKPSYEVQVNLKMLVTEYRREMKEKNDEILEKFRAQSAQARKGQKPQLLEMPQVAFQYMDNGVPRSHPEVDIVKIVEDKVIASLMKLGLATPFNANKLRIHYRTNRGVIPWVYRRDLTFEQFCQFAEHRLGLPGVTVTVRPVRQYLYDSLACHVLGYVSLPDIQKSDEAERKEWDFYVPDDFGVYGVEKSFDTDLRGRPGVQKLLQDEKGHIVREISYEEPRSGNDVWLTLDARIQYIAERALRESQPAIGRGAVVVLQPSTGEVIAMASVPSFNPNKFIPQIKTEDFRNYLDNPCVPLLNRAVRAFAPGSTYKVMVSFAGILAGCEKDHWNCPGGITYGNKYMKCWIAEHGGSHGTLDLTGGLKNSCNCFFYQYGNHAGIGNIEKAGHMFGMGERTGIELQEEDPGILPNPRWLKANHPTEKWSNGTTANTSIGQGFVLATPLQMAGVASAVGNGGIPYRPHLLKKVIDTTETEQEKRLVREQKPDPRDSFLTKGLTAAKLELVRQGMWKVVNEEGGTARAARIDKNLGELAGKTGTAQNWRRDENNPHVSVKDNHTLFICFAPYKDPKYAICVIVEGGKSGGGCAAPVARRIMEQALDLEQGGGKVPIAPVAEVKGDFKQIEQVKFDGIPPVVLKPEERQDENQTTDDDNQPENTANIPTARVVPGTAVSAEPDQEGTRAVRRNQQPPPRRPATTQGQTPTTDPNGHRHLFGQ